MSRLTIVVAATLTNGIGRNAGLPWHLRKEIIHFARLTSNAPEGYMNAVIMGRNTWESIPEKFKPLKKRINVVVSSNTQYELMPADAAQGSPPVYLHSNLESALERVAQPEGLETPLHRSFIIGGASLYRDTLSLPPSSKSFVDRIILTRVLSPSFEDCDVHMPDFQASAAPMEEGGDARSSWKRATHAELQEWAGFAVPEGVQEENGIQYEYQMWTR